MRRKFQNRFTLVEILFPLFIIGCIVSWTMNIFFLVSIIDTQQYAFIALRIIGIFVFPLG